MRIKKAELIRLALSESGEMVVDKKKTLPGRGIYLCPKVNCLEMALKRKGLVKDFRGGFRRVSEGVSRCFWEEEEWQK